MPSSWWKQVFPLTPVKNFPTLKFNKNGIVGMEVTSQVGRGVISVKNIPQYCCSTIDEKSAQLVSICFLYGAGQR